MSWRGSGWNWGSKKSWEDHGGAPQDNLDCAYVTYIWGIQPEVLIDVLTLGGSHEVHGSKIQRIICANDDTRATAEAQLLKAFWTVQDVEHMPLPKHLRKTEQKRLYGVYSKLQTWRIFAEPPWKLKRVLLMDGDMICNHNIDDCFTTRSPAAVMRGEADTNLAERRPAETYFFRGDEKTFTHEGQPMKGGINGGLVLFEPSSEVHEDMMKELETFSTPTGMAEQDFLSWYWGRWGCWWAFHKKLNFQLHQLYYCKGDLPPVGQESSSSYWWLAQHPWEVKIFHYSAKYKPSHMLLGMQTEDSAWSNIDEEVEKFIDKCESVSSKRMFDHFKMDKAHQEQIRAVNKDSLMTWLHMWKETWVRMIGKVLNACWSCVGAECYGEATRDGSWYCRACDEIFKDFEDNDASRVKIRDHLFFNCPKMRAHVTQSMNDVFDLRTLFRVPTGSNVVKKLGYLGRVLMFYEQWGPARWDMHVHYVLAWIAVQIEDSPIYSLMPPIVGTDPALDPRGCTEEDQEKKHHAVTRDTAYNERAVKRRYQRAMVSINKRGRMDHTQWPDNERVQWVSTLRSAADAAEWLNTKDSLKKQLVETEMSGMKKESAQDSHALPPWRSTSSSSSSAGVMPTKPKARPATSGAMSKAMPRPTSAIVIDHR